MLHHVALKHLTGNLVKNPPSSNTGVLGVFSDSIISVRPDYLKLSFKESVLPENLVKFGVTLFRRFEKTILKKDKSTGVLGNVPGWRLDPAALPHNGFRHAVRVSFNGEERGSLQWGGESQKQWVMLELRGAFCALLGEREWKSLFLWAKKKAGRLSQIDIAADDKSGDFFDVFQIRQDHKRNPRNFLSLAGFDRGGKLPKISWQESGVDGCEGATFYHGSPSSALRTRVYEKGKQLRYTLEGIENPNWVRWEQIFRKTNKSFLDIGLIHPSSWSSALLGSSKYFADKFSGTGSHFTFTNMNPVYEPIEIAARAINAFQSQWGGVYADVVRILGAEAAFEVLKGTSKNPIFTDLTRYHADMLSDKVEELRAKGSARGKGLKLFQVDETFDW